jgi:hypothetical protein
MVRKRPTICQVPLFEAAKEEQGVVVEEEDEDSEPLRAST